MAGKNTQKKKAKKKARLGRGLGALLGDVKKITRAETMPRSVGDGKNSTDADNGEKTGRQPSGLREIPIEQLQPGKYQPRLRMDKNALAELGESIKAQGVLQPLLVRPRAKNQYEIIAGERRWQGAQIAGLQTVPAIVRDIEDSAAMAVSLIENIQRENLNAIEEAKGYRRLLDEFGLTHLEVSEAVGCSRAAVSNLLRLLSLHGGVQKMLEEEQIDMGHARALLGLAEKYQVEAAKQVAAKKLSVRQTEQLVKSINRSESPKRNKQPGSTADVLHLQDSLSEKLGAKVIIQHGVKKGKLIIHYYSLDELDGILEKIK